MLSTPCHYSNTLASWELEWRDLYTYLLAHGYQLRPRYQPSPPWPQQEISNWWDREGTASDGHRDFPEISIKNDACYAYDALDALHLPSNTQVVLRLVRHQQLAETLHYIRKLQESGCDSNLSALRILDFLPHPSDPNIHIFVHPLYREAHEPGLESVGELLDLIYQAFIGLVHLHSHNIVNRYGMFPFSNYVVMVPHPEMYPSSWHFIRPRADPSFSRHVYPEVSRATHPPRYLWILGDRSRRIEQNVSEEVKQRLFKEDAKMLAQRIDESFLSGFQTFNLDKAVPRVPSSTYLSLLQHPLFKAHPCSSPCYTMSRSPLGRFIRNIAESPIEEVPTALEALRVLEEFFSVLVAARNGGWTMRYGMFKSPSPKPEGFSHFDSKKSLGIYSKFEPRFDSRTISTLSNAQVILSDSFYMRSDMDWVRLRRNWRSVSKKLDFFVQRFKLFKGWFVDASRCRRRSGSAGEKEKRPHDNADNESETDTLISARTENDFKDTEPFKISNFSMV